MKLVLFSCLIIISLTGFSQANFYQWSKQFGGDSNEQVTDVVKDDDGNIYIYGSYFGSTSLDLNPGSGVFIAPTSWGNFLVKLDSLGDFVWAKCLENSTGWGFFGTGKIHLDKDGNIYIVQGFKGTVDFDPGAGTQNQTAAAGGSVFALKLNNSGGFVWVKLFNSIASSQIVDPRGNDVVTDTLGNVYCLITFGGTIDVNPGAATVSYGGNSPDSYGSSVVVKLDNTGTYVWSSNAGYFMGTSTSQHLLKCLTISSNGNLYVAGSRWNTNSSNSTEYYLAQLTSAGALAWSKESSGTGYAVVNDLILDKQNNPIITGNYFGTVNFNPSGTNNFTSAGSDDVFVTKFSPFGTYTWTKSFGGTLGDYGHRVVVDAFNNINICGYFKSSLFDTDPNAGVSNLTVLGTQEAYILSINSAGDYRWAKSFGGVDNEDPKALAIDSEGNLFVGGGFSGVVDFNPDLGVAEHITQGLLDGFVMKLTNCIYNAPDICLVTADSLAINNMIYWDKGQYPLADSFVVYRYDALTTNYLRIGAVAMSNPNNYLVDTARNVGGPNGGDPQYSSYRYKMAIRGTCGDLGTKGLYHESIFIQQNFQNFNWNAYAIEGQPSPVTGYQFQRDNLNTGVWQVLVNTGGLSTTDPNYLSYPDGNWRVDALGFSCSSTERITINGKDETQTVVVKSKSNIKNNRTVGIKDGKNQEVRLKVYPNPAIEMVNVEVSLVKETKATITIENMLGQVVYTSEIKHQKSEINISTFVSGVYFVKVNTGKGVVVEKIIIE